MTDTDDEDDVLARMADELGQIQAENSGDKLEALRGLCGNLVAINLAVEEAEENLKKLKSTRYELQTKTIPDLMNQVGTDNVGLPDYGVDVVIKRETHASISKDWDDDKREIAFEHLREIGGEDLIKNTLSVSAGKSSDEKMRMLRERVVQIMAELDLDATVKMEPTVQWNTLTSFVKAELKKGTAIDMEAIGARSENVAQIVVRKK